MKNHAIKELHCINCHARHRGAINVHDNNAPFPGAVSICANCGHLMVFADDMTFREPTEKEVLEMAGNKEILDAMKVRILFKRDHDDP